MFDLLPFQYVPLPNDRIANCFDVLHHQQFVHHASRSLLNFCHYFRWFKQSSQPFEEVWTLYLTHIPFLLGSNRSGIAIKIVDISEFVDLVVRIFCFVNEVNQTCEAGRRWLELTEWGNLLISGLLGQTHLLQNSAYDGLKVNIE